MDVDIELLRKRALRLTPREHDVLRLLCSHECLLEKEMPDMLGIGARTFHTHREHLYEKLMATNRQEIILRAVQLGLAPCYCAQLREAEGK